MHQDHTAKALLLLGARVEHHVSCLDLTGVDTQKGEASNVRVSGNFEGEAGELLVGSVFALKILLLIPGIRALCWGQVQGRREISIHSVEQWLHSLVLEGTPAKDGNNVKGECTFSDAFLQLLYSWDLASFQVLFQDFFILLNGFLNQFFAVFCNEILHAFGDFIQDVKLSTQLLALPHEGFLHHQVVNTFEGEPFTNGQCQDQGRATKLVNHHLHIPVEVCPLAIHLVDKANARHAVSVGLAPDCLRLRLHTCDAIKDCHGAIQDSQCSLHFQREIHMPWGINDVYSVVVPEARSGCARDGDATLSLLRHPVHGGRALVNLTDGRLAASVEEDSLSRRRLPCIYVCHDTNVPVTLERDARLSRDLLQLVQSRDAHSHSAAPAARGLPCARCSPDCPCRCHCGPQGQNVGGSTLGSGPRRQCLW
mmetsp:Transcript_47641/g.110374  ORF Transcript_47641/g.110374 Transcript_47641/m.110374 type:complete len:424 (-) Transcript_47641:161-1432(-)